MRACQLYLSPFFLVQECLFRTTPSVHGWLMSASTRRSVSVLLSVALAESINYRSTSIISSSHSMHLKITLARSFGIQNYQPLSSSCRSRTQSTEIPRFKNMRNSGESAKGRLKQSHNSFVPTTAPSRHGYTRVP
jgi:hypothetical protein